jgi:hypothetical protein
MVDIIRSLVKNDLNRLSPVTQVTILLTIAGYFTLGFVIGRF